MKLTRLLSQFMASALCLSVCAVAAYAQEGEDWLVPGNSFVYLSESPDWEDEHYMTIYLGDIGPWRFYRELALNQDPIMYAETRYSSVFMTCDSHDTSELAFVESIDSQVENLSPQGSVLFSDDDLTYTIELSVEHQFLLPEFSDQPMAARTTFLSYGDDLPRETYVSTRDGAVLLQLDWGDGSTDTLTRVIEVATPSPNITREQVEAQCPGVYFNEDKAPAPASSKL